MAVDVPIGIGLQSFDPFITGDEDVTVLASDEGLVDGTVFYRGSGSGDSYIAGADFPLSGVKVEIYQTGADCADLYDPNCFIAFTDSEGRFSQVVPAGTWQINTVGGTGELDSSWVRIVGDNDSPVAIAVQTQYTDHNGFIMAASASSFTKTIEEDSSLTFAGNDFADAFTDSSGGNDLVSIRIESWKLSLCIAVVYCPISDRFL